MIFFKILKYKNFLASGNAFIEIILDKSPRTLYIGNNGAGKSTVAEALTFALFNKAYRNVNKGDLVNSINGKDCIVELEFIESGIHYKIIRGIKPNIFEIYANNTLLPLPSELKDYQEHLERNIIKMNYKTFVQIVILGNAAFTPFMQLSPSDRRSVVESILDITIFSQMNIVLKKDIGEFEKKIDKAGVEAKIIEAKIETIKSQQKINFADIDNQIAEKEMAIKKTDESIEEQNGLLTTLIDDYDKLYKVSEDMFAVYNVKKVKRDKVKSDLLYKQANYLEQKTFFETNDSCPVCKQDITPMHKEHILTEVVNAKLDKIKEGLEKIGKLLGDSEIEAETLADLKEQMKEISEKQYKIKSEISSLQRIRSVLYSDCKRLERQKNGGNHDVARNPLAETSIDDRKNSIDARNEKTLGKGDEKISSDNGGKNEVSILEKLKLELEICKQDRDSLSRELAVKNYLESLLTDKGIKAAIVSKYIPLINQQINYYLNAMDFFVSFQLDETFNETIKSRRRDKFSYYSFSEGEKARINLAILLTWRDIAKLKNSAATNLLIFDETFDGSLDSIGVEDLTKIIEAIKSTNVILISHKREAYLETFPHVLEFTKEKNFSVMREKK